MKTYKNLYPKLCSYNNLELAFKKAGKNKSHMPYIVEFEKNKQNNLLQIKKELESLTYKPRPLTKFVIRDPKTRVIRKSEFRDRIVHHAIVNILEPVYENIFIHDSYANRLSKGTLAATNRFDVFKRKVSKNGVLTTNAINSNMVIGYALKADIRHFFESVNHNVLIEILRRKINDNKVLSLISIILKNHNKKIGMPLGNMTSQFFANVYLNELDYFIKHKLKAKYYLRYVDDFIILHNRRETLEKYKEEIDNYLINNIRLELHKDKSRIIPLGRGTSLLGFRIFYYYKLLRKRNIIQFNKRLSWLLSDYALGFIEHDEIFASIQGWFAYAKWANTYKLRKDIIARLNPNF